MRTFISLEDHFTSETVTAWAQKTQAEPADDGFSEEVRRKLVSVGEERLQDLDIAGIGFQILSHGPTRNCPPLEVCKNVNDEIAKAVEQSNNRLGGFAILPMAEPASAVAELSRCVTQLEFFGALINNRVDGEFLDNEKYWPVFESAQELDVPIYLHPNFATLEDLTSFAGNYTEGVCQSLAGWGWGWHSDTGLHVLRLFASGLFDRYPRLKIIIGHDGEMLPFQLDRILPMSRGWGLRQRGLKVVWNENIWVTTSGMFSIAPFECLRRCSPMSHILFSVDYPFAKNTQGVNFMHELEEKGILNEQEFEMVAFKNAEMLLKIKR